MAKRILIVGGVAGGATAAARLRRLDEHSEIIMYERGGYISFANCGLPYYVGGEIGDKSALVLQTPESFRSRFNVDVRIGCEVVGVDPKLKKVVVKNNFGLTEEDNYDALILAPGADPVRPRIDGILSDKVFTLRKLTDGLRMKDFIDKNAPVSAVIVGGGYIGIEMAENLTRAGLDVTVVDVAGQILPPLDADMAELVHRHLEDNGIKLLLGGELKSVDDDGARLTLTLSAGTMRADMLILAVGVRPNIDFLKGSGIGLNERGYIITDEHMRTTISGVYAVGDAAEVSEFVTKTKAAVPLAGPANKQARIAADNICGINSVFAGAQGSSILRAFELTVATTGINEKTAKRLGLDYEKSFTVSGSHAGYFPGAQEMVIKTLFVKSTGKILGAQIVGSEGVDKRCDVIAAALRFGASANDLSELELCYAPPYSSAKDPVNIAGYVAGNIVSGRMKVFHLQDIPQLQKRSDVILLDTRTTREFAAGHIDGFINIPLNRLRESLGELDKSKKIYVTCQVGQRGYISCRILSQNGFDCYNLSGGYSLYNLAPRMRVDSGSFGKTYKNS